MADVVWTKMGEQVLGGDGRIEAAAQAAQFIMARLGLSLVELVGTATSTSNANNFSKHGATGLYMNVSHGNGYVGLVGAERKPDGYFYAHIPAGMVAGQLYVNPGDIVTYESLSIGGALTAYRFRDMGADGGIVVVPFTVIDHFTNEQRSSMMMGYGSAGDDRVLQVPVPDSYNLEIMDKIPMGGGIYPASITATVAAPVMLKTNTFYGYMESQSCLYHVNDQGGRLGTQIQIAGTTFTCIGGHYYAR